MGAVEHALYIFQHINQADVFFIAYLMHINAMAKQQSV